MEQALSNKETLLSHYSCSYVYCFVVPHLDKVLTSVCDIHSHCYQQDMRLLLATWVAALPAFANVGSLVGLFLFIYSYIGVFMFGELRLNVGVNESYNFKNFGRALLLLIRVATGDNWCGLHYLEVLSFACYPLSLLQP
jgi:hypothetical protein